MSSIMRRRRGPISAIEGSRLEGWASRPQSSQTGRPPSNPSPQSRGSRFVQSPWSPRTLAKTVQLVAYCSAPGCPNDQIQKALCWQPAPPKARPGHEPTSANASTIAPTPYGSSPTDTNRGKYRPSAEKIPRCARDDNTLGFHSTKFVIPSAARESSRRSEDHYFRRLVWLRPAGVADAFGNNRLRTHCTNQVFNPLLCPRSYLQCPSLGDAPVA